MGRRRRVAVAVSLGAVGVGAWCGWVSGFHRSTTPAQVTWVVSLAFVVAVDLLWWAAGSGRLRWWHLARARQPWPRPGRGGARRALLGTAPWLVLVLVALVWEILGIDTGPRVPHLTISALAQQYRPMNAALLLVWLVVGVGYGAARARAPITTVPPDQRRPPPGRLAAAALPPTVHLGPVAPALLLPASRAAGVAFWLAWIAAFGLVDLAARLTGGAVPDGEEFLRFITRPRWANALLVVAWAYAGFHLFAR